MRLPVNSRHKLLSLLMDIAQCTFLRVIEHKHDTSVRYQQGEFLEAFNQFDNPNNDLDAPATFYNETSYSLGEYQLNIVLINEQYMTIECTHHNDISDIGENTRRTQNLGPSRLINFEISLYHEHALPLFVQDLGIDNERVTNLTSNNDDDSAHKAHVLLNGIIVSVEGLQLIDHYQKLTSDSLTKLQSRTSLQREIDDQIYHSSIALCMVHCTDFQQVNRKFGQAKGDNVLHEIAKIINEYTRTEDISGRFGGALFGIAIHAQSLEDGYKLAVKLQNALHNKPYLQNAIRLSFNVGVAFVSQDEAELESNATSSILINRAEQALKGAQNSNTPSIVQWEPDKFRLDEQEFNYLGGIFTPDNVTNYRNMLLLWDISSIIADEPSFSKLLRSVIERLSYTFEFEYAGIISTLEGSDGDYGYKLDENTEITQVDWALCEYNETIKQAANTAIEHSQHAEHEENGNKVLIIPLGTDTKECFFIIGAQDHLDLTHDSVMLFVGFARQIGKALKRSQLEDELNKKLEMQNAQLAQELTELKAGMQSGALVYRSAKMQQIVEQTQRAAQSDATVLVTGESGTGKEKLIHAVHSLGPRSDKPLIIVDCGSIPETLIESELFGHTKGAFTGAQSDSKGKIQAANGGLLVLDEIGELPMSMQPKLLRFVQEKHYTPVGSTRAIAVDVKIVAVTNRDLAYEVAQGRFRKDLFYRLNVVSLHNPPLRERTEDIDLLCQHFLSKFARQFEMEKKFLNNHTINLMKAYDWPGNIRELENKLMQASLLTKGEEIQFKDLNLGDSDPGNYLSKTASVDTVMPEIDIQTPVNHKAACSNADTQDVASVRLANNNFTGEENANVIPASINANAHVKVVDNSEIDTTQWQNSFVHHIDLLIVELSEQRTLEASVGSALEAQLLHIAYNQCGSHAKTALLLQIPVSTARRRLMKALPNAGEFEHSEHWHKLLELLWQLVNQHSYFQEPVEFMRNLLASRILAAYSSNMTLAAKLMGVSEPTMYKLRKLLAVS